MGTFLDYSSAAAAVVMRGFEATFFRPLSSSFPVDLRLERLVRTLTPLDSLRPPWLEEILRLCKGDTMLPVLFTSKVDS